MPFKIGARKSKLARIMAQEVKDLLLRFYDLSPTDIEIENFETTGDKIQNQALSDFGGKGLFTKEIEESLLTGRISLAVHSAKDMPIHLPEGLKIIGFLPREDVRDAFISRDGAHFKSLKPGSIIGTAALRRRALVKKLRPDLEVEVFRGNVDTRLRKLENGVVDGTFLALCGLKRMQLEHIVTEIMDVDDFLPSPGQGAICLEIRADDQQLAEFLQPILDQKTGVELACERSFLNVLEGSCRTALSCYARLHEDTIHAQAAIYLPNGESFYKIEETASKIDSELLGQEMALQLKKIAGESFFRLWRDTNPYTK